MRFKFNSKIITYAMLFIVVVTMIKKYMTYHKSARLLGNSYYFKGKKPGMKYILLWTKEDTIPFVYMGMGQSGFIGRQCQYTNCIVSGNESLLGTTIAFDAVMFAGPELADTFTLPAQRLPYQKFVFASIESPVNYPLCAHNFDGYFNWTWTYKLNSDVRWGYIAIKDSNDNIIGPNKDMHWIKWYDMKPVNETFTEQLKNKTKAVAWFVSNCRSRSRREGYVKLLKKELLYYKLDVDVYGGCGLFLCSRDEQQRCNDLISKDYYFYLSFENAFSEDYVTEKLLIPLQNNAVPIVYGGANYSRFLPEQSYLNARELGIYKLAEKIYNLIHDPKRYAEYFRWKNYYTYHKTTMLPETNEYCNMCAALNDEKSMKPSVYTEFSDFWEVYDTC